MQRLLAVLSLSQVGQTTVLHLLGSLYPSHRRVTVGEQLAVPSAAEETYRLSL